MHEHSAREEIITFVTAPSEDEASGIARALVESRLAACVNIVRNIRSIYRWQGAVEDDSEVLMVVKTERGLFAALSEKVKEMHSYDVPEIIAIPIVDGSESYLEWIRESTS